MKPCTNCGVQTYGKYCCSCARYFKNGGKIHPLPLKGIIVYIDDQVVCNICGMAFDKLMEHVKRKHHMSSREYRQEFELEIGARLTSLAYQEKMSNHAKEHKTYDKNFKESHSGEKRWKFGRIGKQSLQEVESRREEQRKKGRLSKSKLTPERKKELDVIWTKNLPHNKK